MEKYQLGDYVEIKDKISHNNTRGRIREVGESSCWILFPNYCGMLVDTIALSLVYRPELDELLTDNNRVFRDYAKKILKREEVLK